jgi:hypothetical protein
LKREKRDTNRYHITSRASPVTIGNQEKEHIQPMKNKETVKTDPDLSGSEGKYWRAERGNQKIDGAD